MLENTSTVTFVPKKEKNYFLKILNFVQSFVECKVSLADSIHSVHFLCEPRFKIKTPKSMAFTAYHGMMSLGPCSLKHFFRLPGRFGKGGLVVLLLALSNWKILLELLIHGGDAGALVKWWQENRYGPSFCPRARLGYRPLSKHGK